MSNTEQPTKGPFNGKELLRSVGIARRKQIIIALLSFLLPLLFALTLLRRQDVAWQNNGLQGIPVRSLTVSQNTLYAISSGGIFRSSDGVRWQAINNGLPVTLWDGIVVRSLAVDAQDPSLAYVLVSDGKDRLELFRTTNSGDKWEQMTLPDASEVLYTLALVPGKQLTLFVAGNTGVYRSHDGGESWKWQGIIPRGTKPQTLTADTESPGTLYLGTLQHGVFRTADGGRSWSAVNNGLDNQPVRQLLVNPVDHRVLFALAERGVYRSVDAGQHWQFVGRDLQGQEITTMAAHPSRVGVVYVGTADGQVLLTADAGDTWANLGSKLGKAPVAALVFDQDSVRVATDSGLWQFNLELPPGLTPPATVVAIAPSATPTGTPVPSATPTPTASPTETPTASLTPTALDTPTPSPTLRPTNTSVPPPTTTPTPIPTATPTPVPPPTATPLPTPTATATPTARPTGEPPTDTPTPSLTPSPTTPPTVTPTGPRPTLPAGTPLPTDRPTTTSVPTPTFTPLPTNTPTITPTATIAPTPTLTATATTTSTAALIRPPTGGTGSITALGAFPGGMVIQQAFLFVMTKPEHDLTRQITDVIVRVPGQFRWDLSTPSSLMLNMPPSVVVITAQSEPQRRSGVKRSDRI